MLHLAGHRGLPSHYPENTIEGLTAALSSGADGVEIDIQFSKDGEPVLLHDFSLQRVTGLQGNVSAFELNLLLKISAHEPDRFGDAFLPTPITPLVDLNNVIRSYPNSLLFVEIKEESFEHINPSVIVAKVISCLTPIAEQVVIISYNLGVLRLLRDQSDWPVGWILDIYNSDNQQLAAEFQPEYLICNYTKLPANQSPLWVGLWQWFIYDVTRAELALELAARGVEWVESWDVEALIVDLRDAT
jgi:glycerophosphoryl diester phosphodiesterase